MTANVSHITVELPFPNKILWPNGRCRSKSLEASLFKKHKAWAHDAAWAALGRAKFIDGFQGRIPVHVIVTRKGAGVYPDADNTVASLKAYLDGIALRLGINDARFAVPSIEFQAPITAKFIITIGRAQ